VDPSKAATIFLCRERRNNERHYVYCYYGGWGGKIEKIYCCEIYQADWK
jgi:hypothetical protein